MTSLTSPFILMFVLLSSACTTTLTMRVTTAGVRPETAVAFHTVVAAQRRFCTDGVTSERRSAYTHVQGPIRDKFGRPREPLQVEVKGSTYEEVICK